MRKNDSITDKISDGILFIIIAYVLSLVSRAFPRLFSIALALGWGYLTLGLWEYWHDGLRLGATAPPFVPVLFTIVELVLCINAIAKLFNHHEQTAP